MLHLTPQQERAKRRITAWWNTDDPETTLTGYAGTGKSTAISNIISGLDARPLYLAPTGKAAAVLRAKTGLRARTIHSVLYETTTHEEPRIHKGKPVLGFDGKPLMVTRPHFELRRHPHEDVTDCGIIIVDEMSMVTKKEADNLRSLGRRIIAVGDPGQLPPVKADPGFTPDTIDLTDVVRQAHGSPVLEIATRIRRGKPPGTCGTSGRVTRFTPDSLPFFTRADRQILCWRHETRQAVNRLVRTVTRRLEAVPQGGEKVSILRNNATFGVYRGQQYTVKWTDHNGGPVPRSVKACLVGDDGGVRVVPLVTSGFAGQDGEWAAEQDGGGEYVAATWGYAITVHSAQGSEWADVLVLDQPLSRPRDRRMDRWLYTAVTRASDRVMIARESAVL